MATIPTNRNTGNTAAEHVSDHNLLHTAYNNQIIYLKGNVFENVGSSATVDTRAINLPNIAGDPFGKAGQIPKPEGWATVNIDFLWTPSTANAGTIALYVQTQMANPGVALGGIVSHPVVLVPNTGFGSVNLTRMVDGFAWTDDWVELTVVRDADHASDTYPDTCSVLAVVVRKAS